MWLQTNNARSVANVSSEQIRTGLGAGQSSRTEQANPDPIFAERDRSDLELLEQLVSRTSPVLGLGLDQDQPGLQRDDRSAVRQAHAKVTCEPLGLSPRGERDPPKAGLKRRHQLVGRPDLRVLESIGQTRPGLRGDPAAVVGRVGNLALVGM